MSQKRNRSVNWEEDEKQLLRMVVKDHTNIVENKSTDTSTNKAKTKAWNEILKKFNEHNFRPRGLTQLQMQWRTIKYNARKRSGSKNDESIVDSVNPVEPVTDSSAYDSDGFLPTQESVEPAIQIMEIPKEFPAHNIAYDPLNSTADKDFSQNNSGTHTSKQTPAKKKECIYTREIITHSKFLKDTEHKRSMERAEEEHLCRMEIHKINLKKAKMEVKCAEIELEILEIRKVKEKLLLERELKN